jgi:HEAT repeat protein
VHAAEALVALHRPAPALAAFRPVRDSDEPVQRILIWRVLAAAEPDAETRREYVERIRAALMTPDGPDRTHAMESLAKLDQPAVAAEHEYIQDVADGAGPASPFALWRLAQAGNADSIGRLAKLLRSRDAVTRSRAIYVLGRLKTEHPAAGAALSAALAAEPSDSPARCMLRSAVGGDALRQVIDDAGASPGGRYLAAVFLSDSGEPRDYPSLARLLEHPDGDVRVGAAYAMLKIDARSARQAPPSAPR